MNPSLQKRPTGLIGPAKALAGLLVAGALSAGCSSKPIADGGSAGFGGGGGAGFGGGGGADFDGGGGAGFDGAGGAGFDGGQDALPDLPSDRGLPFSGQRSYAVTSLLQRDGGVGPFPASHAFTLVLDAERRTAIAGGAADGTLASFEPTGAGALRFTGTLRFQLPECARPSISYMGLTITIDASDRLTGTGQGELTIFTDDIPSTASATMSLTGERDVQSPTLSISGDAADPFESFSVMASEPLPPSAGLVLRAAGREPIALEASGMAGSFVTRFQKPAQILRYATQYQIATDGITDFAGNAAAGTGGFVFTTLPLPPLAPEDGFESVTDATFGGVQVLSGAGEPTITGTKSLYIPPTGFSQPALRVRLPLAAGDTVVRFALRTVTPGTSASEGFSCCDSWVVGSESGTVALPGPSTTTGTRTNATIGGTPVTLGPIVTASFVLPADAANEVVFQRTYRAPSQCGFPFSPPAGLIIDDLRVE